MRARNPGPATGRLLTWFDPRTRANNRSILFAVAGAEDIVPLTQVSNVVEQQSKDTSPFVWTDVADSSQTAEIEPDVDATRISKIEAAELRGLNIDELAAVLTPALDALARGEAELFPTAGGAVGAPAEGVQFIGREDSVSAVLEHLLRAESVLLVAPRRSGKTSLLRRLEHRLWAMDQNVVALDLERDSSFTDAVARLRGVTNGEAFAHARKQANRDGWGALLGSTFLELMERRGAPLYVLLDELVWLLQEIDGPDLGVQQELERLGRTLSEAGARLVVAGSMDLGEYLTHELGLSSDAVPAPFNSLLRYPLPPLGGPQLTGHFRRLLIGSGLVPEQDDLRWLTENVDLGAPYPALLFLDQLATKTRAHGHLSVPELETELARFLDSTPAFDDIALRLSKKLTHWPRAEEAVSAIAQAQTGFDERELLAVASPVDQAQARIRWLIDTFPFTVEHGRVCCASRLFARWWLRRQGLEQIVR
jgi:hypothetical protein